MLRALVVTNMYPTPERPASGPFVRDQVEALRRRGDVEIELFDFPAGTRNYPRAARELRRRYRGQRFDIVHVHFGLVAWPALLAGLRPLVVTLHGNDLLHPRSRPFTRAALPLTALPAAVSRAFSRNVPGAGRSRRVAILPMGVDLTRFRPIPRAEARAHLGLDPAGPYLLFPHEPSRPLKRFDRAQGGGGRRPPAHARQRRPGGRALLDQRRQRGDRPVPGRGLRPRGDRGVGLQRARVRHAGRRAPGRAGRDRGLGVPGMGRASAGGRPCARTSRPRTRGSTAARPPSASRPTGWPRASWRHGARCWKNAPSGHLYSLRRDA